WPCKERAIDTEGTDDHMLIEGTLPVYQRFISQIVVREVFMLRSRTSLSIGVMCPGERCMSDAKKRVEERTGSSLAGINSPPLVSSLACNLWLPCRHCQSRRRYRVTGSSHRPALLRNHHGLTR